MLASCILILKVCEACTRCPRTYVVTIVLLVVSHAAACYACWSPPHRADTQPPKQKGQSPAEESADHSADANISDRDPEVDASVKQTREGKQGQDGKLHILIAVFQ